MSLTTKVALALSAVAVATIGCAQEKSVRIVIWDERQPKQQPMYQNFLGNHITNYLNKQEGFSVRSVGMDDPQQGDLEPGQGQAVLLSTRPRGL